ncbi:barstar family protein [Streptomyces sp. NBC_00828]|uniref:barstar family protein n=1 Tax=Streptomyces sp. NBC_00828 TaxID=2903678 RepID=UPI0038670EC3
MAVTYTLDGAHIQILEDFWRVMGEAVNGPEGYFGSGLNSFADCLRGGFGTPEGNAFTVEWQGHDASRQHLGYPETVRQLELRLERCDPSNRMHLLVDLAAARDGRGPTVFDWLVDIFEDEAPGVLRLV